MSATRVCKVSDHIPGAIYIGRPGKGKGGPYGNPHVVGWCSQCKTTHARGEAMAAFKHDFLQRVTDDLEYRKAVLQLYGHALECFCRSVNDPPEAAACHGDVYVEWLDDQRRLHGLSL